MVVKSAVPIPDLGLIDAALRGDAAALKAAVQKHRPADPGRDFSRRSVAECRRLIEAADDRRAAAMLRSAHPAVAANVIGSCSPGYASRLLAFMPTDHRIGILGAVEPGDRGAIEAALPPEQKDDATRTLAFGESAVARLMLGEVRMKNVLRVLAKEVTSGIVLGVLLGAIAFGRARLRGVGNDLAGCVGITVLVVCTWASTVGPMIPIAAQRVGVDPTVISGPLSTTLVDASGLFLYLSIAKLMVANLHGG